VPAYYNEIDPYAAQWLRNLIAAGHIAAGDVDERSIVDVRPDDLGGYQQAHFFAGIGGWSYALRLAGWPDERPVWTGSCPCQPFSAAGAGKAANDSRHLWPAWFSLIAERRPAIVFGEQVEAAIGWGWLDLVFADLEGQGYACGASILPACSVGAPHIRNRLWFVADANGRDASATRLQRSGQHGLESQDGSARGELADSLFAGWPEGRTGAGNGQVAGCGRFGELGDANDSRSQGRLFGRDSSNELSVGPPSLVSWLADTGHEYEGRPAKPIQTESGWPLSNAAGRSFWHDAEWLPCTDGKARPIEPGTFPLAHGIRGRVGRLRAYGNAIVPQVGAEFIAAFMESCP
jgi:DNA (cytosine-5)-methyltransferase 1